MKALTNGVEFELQYQRDNEIYYLYRILKNGMYDSQMAISKDWNTGDTVVIRFYDKNNLRLATHELEFDKVRNRSQFIFWITETFLNGYTK